ncbi:hypothetical protein SCANM63S_07339 [Streptomyces canarius]
MPILYHHVRPKDEAERAYLEGLIRDDDHRYRRHVRRMKQRAAFCREDKGIYRDWLAIAAARADAIATMPVLMAAE